MNRSFHDEDPEHFVLPDTRELAAQYLLLYEMSGGDELGDYVTGDRARASLELRMKIAESSLVGRVADDLDESLASRPGPAWNATATGMGALWIQLQDYITSSQIRGFLLAFGVVALLLCLLFRSFKTGMIAMVPNLTPVILILGGMGWAGIPLDYIRLMIATVALGIAVDDTIHHVTRMHVEFNRTGSYAQALENSMRDVGRALVITSLVLVAGFLTFLGSRLDTYAIFGPLLAGTITAALIADFLLMPALVLVLEPFGPERVALEDSATAATGAQAAQG